jgi:hypothetical protein
LESANKAGEPPRAPRWAKTIWDALKIEVLIESRGRSVMTDACRRLFDKLGDKEFRTRVIVVLSCIDDPTERAQAAFEFATEGLSIFCKCGRRLLSLDELSRTRCDKCNWHDRHY